MVHLLKFISLFVMPSLLLAACTLSKKEDGGLRPTIYYKPTIVADRSKCSPNALKDMISPAGKILETLCEKDYRQCLMQGSCFVESDQGRRSYNVYSSKGGMTRFVEVDTKKCPFGYGVKNSCLDPYFSVAADLSIYSLGDVIFVPRLVGLRMPNGEYHDGFVIVRDKGGRIVGPDRFDFFTGFYDHLAKENTLAQVGFGDPKNRFEFRMATAEESKSVHEKRGYPGIIDRGTSHTELVSN